MLKILSNKKGFTLIELIVVFTVMAILATIGTVSLVSYSRTQTLNQATSDLVQTLNTAKSLSASQLKTLNKNGNTYLQCQNQSLSGYGVYVSANQASRDYHYSIYIACITNTGIMSKYPDPTTSNPLQVKLPTDVVINPATSKVDIFFPVLSGGITATNGNSVVLKSVYSGISSKTIHFSQGYISVTSP
jgi:prepilin-type N-terminal cleavage/methylation domain-containing protein